MPSKRRSVDVGDGVARAVDSVMDDCMLHKMATIIIEDVVRPTLEFLRLVELPRVYLILLL